MKKPARKRKAFKTSPSIRIPVATVEKPQQLKWQVQVQSEDIIRLSGLAGRLQGSVHAAAHDNAIYVDALRDAVKLIDTMHQRAGKRPLPLLDGAEIKRLEEIRLLSLGV